MTTTPPVVIPEGTPPVPPPYARVRVPYGSDARLGVAFVESSTRDDGSLGDERYFRHAGGGWDNDFDPVKHVRPLDRSPAEPNDQSFAVPDDVLARDGATARVHQIDADGAPRRHVETLNANQLYNLVRGFTATP